MIVKMPGESWTEAELEQVRQDVEHCALCNGPSSNTDGGIVLIKRSAEFPYHVAAMLGSCCMERLAGGEHDAVVAELRAKACVSPDELDG